MKALILNSGVGQRMGLLTQSKPKCMTEISGGETILKRQLQQLHTLGVAEAVVTTGHLADVLRGYANELPSRPYITYVHNPDYASTNYIVSMHLAAPHLAGEDVLLLHGDLVLEDSVLQELLQSKTSAMTVDHGLPLPQKDFKARLTNGRIVSVGVEFFGDSCVACQPAYKWLAQDFGAWLQSIHTFVSRGETTVYGENAFNALEGALPLFPLELHGRLCHEIDNASDLASVSNILKAL